MAASAGVTAFVTGAGGFIGMELVKVLVARGHHVIGLTGSLESTARVRRAGAMAVMGDLLEPGVWQDEAAAEWVFHLVPHRVCRSRLTRRRAGDLTRTRVLMDAHLLDAVAAGRTRRLIYLADTSCYGAHGQRAITEDTPPRRSAWGDCFAPALSRLEGYFVAGLPIITALAGWVYGNAGWFRDGVIERVMTGRRVRQFGKTGPWISPIHLHDCAAALVHLAERGECGRRYFLANDYPVQLNELAAVFARVSGRPLRVCRLPAAAAPVAMGPVIGELMRSDAVFSNIRMRGIGFRFSYPTLAEGMAQILDAIDEERLAASRERTSRG
jgi:nucleoside-diphosphate-sugar epimerase